MIEEDASMKLEGKLHIVKSSKRIQYYIRTNYKEKSGRYISKSEKETIKQYIQKKYNEGIQSVIAREIKDIERLIRSSGDATDNVRELFSANPQEIKDMIIPFDINDDDFINEWVLREYTGKSIQDNVPVYITDKGERVRSKSELNIANMLYKKNVPYKYECPLLLSSGMTIYPDFTVLNIKKRKEIYWEHRGMMGDEKYAVHSVRRLKEYSRENIYLGSNLIITEETLESPLGTDEIEGVINYYFCQ